jgi:hypothetical protein
MGDAGDLGGDRCERLRFRRVDCHLGEGINERAAGGVRDDRKVREPPERDGGDGGGLLVVTVPSPVS